MKLETPEGLEVAINTATLIVGFFREHPAKPGTVEEYTAQQADLRALAQTRQKYDELVQELEEAQDHAEAAQGRNGEANADVQRLNSEVNALWASLRQQARDVERRINAYADAPR